MQESTLARLVAAIASNDKLEHLDLRGNTTLSALSTHSPAKRAAGVPRMLCELLRAHPCLRVLGLPAFVPAGVSTEELVAAIDGVMSAVCTGLSHNTRLEELHLDVPSDYVLTVRQVGGRLRTGAARELTRVTQIAQLDEALATNSHNSRLHTLGISPLGGVTAIPPQPRQQADLAEHANHRNADQLHNSLAARLALNRVRAEN